MNYTVYISINKHRDERELSPEEVQAIWENCATEQRGHAVYDVEEIVVIESEETGWERRLWAYRIGDTWTYVPAAFESMTLHWAD